MSSDGSFEQFPDEFDLVTNEERVLEFFDDKKIYQKQVIKHNGNGPKLGFLDGPVFTSAGILHIGNLHVSVCKSLVLNYKSMCGFNVQNMIGWDNHGVPSETMSSNLLGLKTRQDIIKYGVAKYNAFCKTTVSNISDSWEKLFKRTGRFVDFNNQYKTMDKNYMETCWWAIKQLWDKELIYRGFKVLHFSTGLSTPLSNQEAGQNYKDVVDMTMFVKFKATGEDDLYYVSWTTTIWTLPSNLSLCVNSKLDYCIIRDHETGHRYVIGKDALENLYPTPKKKDWVKPYDVLETDIKGENLVGRTYEPLFTHFADGRQFKIISAPFVTAEAGTGIVHLAPSHGEDDYNACMESGIVNPVNLGEFCVIDEEGRFTPKVKQYAGVYFGDANKLIIKDLKQSGNCIKLMEYKHSYPFCYRTNTPLIYLACKAYFIDVPKLRDQLVANNQKINWIPENIRDGHSHNWLKGAKEWCITRSRFFGTPAPFWQSKDGSKVICIGSIEELCRLGKLKHVPTDIHPEFIDDIVIEHEEYGPLRFVGDVLDCWVESAVAALGQIHYPFENNEHMFDDRECICDFVLESSDQVTNWFYNLNVMTAGLFGKPAFANVITTGLILAPDGTKISKSKGNFVDPYELFKEYGCDAIRLYLTSSSAAHGVALKFSIDDVSDVSKRLLQLYNVYKFFLEHAIMYNKEGYMFGPLDYQKSDNVMDRWILARVSELTGKIRQYMDAYTIYRPYAEIQAFIEDLANWYVKFNRIRMKGRGVSRDEQGACLSTCWNALMTLSKLLAPFAPFISETFYQYMKVLLPADQQMESVHLCDYPMANQYPRYVEIERKMSRLQHVAGIVRNLRANSKRHTSVKMPIETITVLVNDPQYIEDIKEVQQLLVEDVNCFTVNYGELGGMVQYTVKPDHKVLGQRYRDKANDIKKAISEITSDVAQTFVDGTIDYLTVTVNGVEYQLGSDCVSPVVHLNYAPKADELTRLDDGVMVIGNFECTDRAVKMYTKSLFIRAVQDMRKGTKLHSWNKIGIYYSTNDKIMLELLTEFHDEISRTLLYEINDHKSKPDAEQIIVQKDCQIGNFNVKITITDVTGEFLKTVVN